MTSRQKKIIFGALGAIIFFIIIAIAFRKPVNKPATLEIWGVNDNPSVMYSLTSSFQKLYPNITVKYTQKEASTYQNDLLQAFASNKGPDIFIIPGNWIPLYQDKIASLDLTKDKDLNLRIINETYPQIVQDDLVSGNSLLGIPLSIDTLALYYNKDIFDYYKIPLPPQTWQDVLNLVPKLRKINTQGQIIRAAIALGTSNNVAWSTDILSDLMMQLGTQMVDKQNQRVTFDNSISQTFPTAIPSIEALQDYTQFADPQSKLYTWDNGFPNSVYAFSQGKTAMMIGYSQDRKLIQQYAPDLRYGVAPFPYIGDLNTKIDYGRTMDIVVFNRSSHIQEAWQFLKYLSQTGSASYYFSQTKNPPARLDLISSAMNDPQVGIFASQILTSRDWYQIDFQQVNQIFSDMINSVLLNNITPDVALSTAASRLEFLWQQKSKTQ
jgi:multiple sugar transport system substrate-binding protein